MRADDVRALASAIVLGSSAGLVIGAAYLLSSGGRLAPHPAPTASGPLQADQARVQPTPTPQSVALAMRDRFRVAAQSQAGAQPFRFRQVADAPTDLHCLAEAVYFEARGEAADGQQAVAQVVLNRVRHPAFPKTICAVVHQHTASGCQFAFACNGKLAARDSLAWRKAESIASSEMHGAVMTAVGDATHFQASRGGAFAGLMRVAQIGAHVFYRLGGHAGAPAMFHQMPSISTESTAGPDKIELAKLDPTSGKDASTALTPYKASVAQVSPTPASDHPAVTTAKLVSAAAAADVKPETATHTASPPAKVADPPPAKAVVALALAQS